VTSQDLGQVTFTSETVRENPIPRSMRWWNFEKFKIFRKIEKGCKRSEMRTKPKIFEKFGKKLNLKIFKNS
jgi:hypothetical protein